jgi:hypothetical protein
MQGILAKGCGGIRAVLSRFVKAGRVDRVESMSDCARERSSASEDGSCRREVSSFRDFAQLRQ